MAFGTMIAAKRISATVRRGEFAAKFALTFT
jgi:hypothetical protein